MEMLEDKIREFSDISNGSCTGASAGNGDAIGRGFGGGYGICNNDHNGTDGVCAVLAVNFLPGIVVCL